MSDDPVEPAEEGTAETTPEGDTAEPIEAATDDSAEGQDEDAEGEAPEGEEPVHAKSDVKYSRFRSVNERRKAAEAEVAKLQAQVAALQPKVEEPAPKGTAERLKNVLKPAPANMTALQQMEFYTLEALQSHLPEMLDQWFEKNMGLKPDAAAATLQHATVSSRQSIVQQFEEAAKTHGLDPRDQGLRDAVGSLMDTGRYRTFADAMDTFRPKTALKPPPGKVNGRGASEIETLDLTGLPRVNVLPKNAKEAHTLAAAGKRIATLSVTDILNATQKS